MCDVADVGFSQAHITISMYSHTCISDTPLDSVVGARISEGDDTVSYHKP